MFVCDVEYKCDNVIDQNHIIFDFYLTAPGGVRRKKTANMLSSWKKSKELLKKQEDKRNYIANNKKP